MDLLDRQCPVCFDDNPFPPIVLVSCGHVVCGPCVLNIAANKAKYTCPICITVVTGHVVCQSMRSMFYDTVTDAKKNMETDVLSNLSKIQYLPAPPQQPSPSSELVQTPPEKITFYEQWKNISKSPLILLLIAMLVIFPNFFWMVKDPSMFAQLHDHRLAERNDARNWYIKTCIYPPVPGPGDTITSEILTICERANELRNMDVDYAAFGDFMHHLAGLKSKRKIE